MATKSINTILTNLQNDVSDLAAYVAGSVPTGGVVPANIAQALTDTNTAISNLQTVVAANPFVIADVLTAYNAALSAVQTLGSAIASPSTP